MVDAVWRLSTAAYRVEAEIIADDRIPALRLGPESIDRRGDWHLVEDSRGQPVAVSHVLRSPGPEGVVEPLPGLPVQRLRWQPDRGCVRD